VCVCVCMCVCVKLCIIMFYLVPSWHVELAIQSDKVIIYVNGSFLTLPDYRSHTPASLISSLTGLLLCDLAVSHSQTLQGSPHVTLCQ